jgi:hypothetical protein
MQIQQINKYVLHCMLDELVRRRLVCVTNLISVNPCNPKFRIVAKHI